MDNELILRLKKIWIPIFWGCACLFLISFFVKGSFPDVSEMDEKLFLDPVQGPTDRQDFSFSYRGEEYFVHPMYSYEMSGLVLSHNNIGGFGDIYHDKNSVDLKDICVMWGGNIKRESYKTAEVKNVSFACWIRIPPEGVADFQKNELSNSHLLASDPKIQEKIRSIQKGDQVHIKGLLVSYSHNGSSPRTSSTTRDDTGMTACEVFFVDEIEILRPATPLWFSIFSWGKVLLPLLLFGRIALWWYEKKKEHEAFMNDERFRGQ